MYKRFNGGINVKTFFLKLQIIDYTGNQSKWLHFSFFDISSKAWYFPAIINMTIVVVVVVVVVVTRYNNT